MEKKAVILAIGSFNPPTNGHLQIATLEKKGMKVVESILSPVADGYGKKTLISADHRFAMCVAAAEDLDWLRADDWECQKPEWTAALDVLKHHSNDVKNRVGGKVRTFLLVGGDVVDRFPTRNADGTFIWNQEDVIDIIKIGLIIQPRPGFTPMKTLESMPEIAEFSNDIIVIENGITLNDISSTRLRAAIAEGRSVKYSTPDAVINYIKKHSLYKQ
ncbi:unnamed protein product [Caenorhabditis sp. 36 PRJEB53466]|nr:unnamed protein product [Caenorhabditis sp. 36 PRJEB53466]